MLIVRAYYIVISYLLKEVMIEEIGSIELGQWYEIRLVHMIGASFLVYPKKILIWRILEHQLVIFIRIVRKNECSRRAKNEVKTGFVINISYLYWYLILYQLPHQSCVFFLFQRYLSRMCCVSLIILFTFPIQISFLFALFNALYSWYAKANERRQMKESDNRK